MSSKLPLDPSLLELFRAEMETHVPTLSNNLLALEKEPNQPKRLEVLMRAAHSIKGAAKIVGVDPAVRLAHVMEDVFVAAQKEQLVLHSDAVDALLQGVDLLQRLSSPSDDPTTLLDDATVSATAAVIAGIKNGEAPRRASPASPKPTEPPTLMPQGNLDNAEAESLRQQLADLLAKGTSTIRVDLGSVNEIGPAGLAVLALAAREAAKRTPATNLHLVNTPSKLTGLLHLTRLDRITRSAIRSPS